jgi:hypothetical protein
MLSLDRTSMSVWRWRIAAEKLTFFSNGEDF